MSPADINFDESVSTLRYGEQTLALCQPEMYIYRVSAMDLANMSTCFYDS